MRQLRNTYYIIINGQCYSGKDTFVEYCGQYVPCNNISTVDTLRNIANQVFYYDHNVKSIDKCKQYRNFIHQLKKMVKKYNPNYFKYCVNDRLRKNNLNFIHCREEKEFKDYGKCIKVLVVNPNSNQSDTELSDIDKSHNFNDLMYDHIILNDGDLDQLKEKAKIFTNMFT